MMFKAQSRSASGEDSAYVFGGRSTADPVASDLWLGRTWRAYAHVDFLLTRMDAAIAPEGWREWTPGKTDTFRTTYDTEYRSTALGGSPRGRVLASHQLSTVEAKQWRYKRLFGNRASWVTRAIAELYTATRPL